jgi:hypothetical protein
MACGHHAWPQPERHGGKPTADAMTAKVSNKPRGNGHWTSAYMPLQENLGGEAMMGVLTGAELGSVAALNIGADKWLEVEEVPRDWFSNYTRTARACGTWRRCALVTRGEGNGSHQWRAVGGHVMHRVR